jgi:hypothetical protein
MRLRTTSSIVGIVLATAIAACGGSGSSDNGVSSRSPNQILTAAVNAADGLRSVHMAGTVNQGQPITVDLQLANGRGGRGTMSLGGVSFQIVSIGSTAYFSGGQAFWQRFAGPAAAQLLQGRWLKAPTAGNLGSLAKLTDMKALFGSLLSTHGTLTKGSTTTVNGTKAIGLSDATQGGTLYIATTGQPYPLRIAKGGTGGGQLTFDRFNASVSLTAPANAIDVSRLQGK